MVSGAEWRLRAQDIGCWSTGLHLTLSWLYIHAFLVKYRKCLSDFPFSLLAVSLTLTEVNQLISKSGRIVQQVMCMYCEINANLYNWRSTAVRCISVAAQGWELSRPYLVWVSLGLVSWLVISLVCTQGLASQEIFIKKSIEETKCPRYFIPKRNT